MSLPPPTAAVSAHRQTAHPPDPPANASDAGHLALFNDPRFHAVTARPPHGYRRVDHVADGRLIGSLCGTVAGDIFQSGWSAPFGGPDLTSEDHPLPLVLELAERAVEELRGEGISEIRIRARPACWSRAEPVVHYALHQAGFRVEDCRITQHVDLTTLDDTSDYLDRLKPKRGRDVRRDLDGPLVFSEARDDDALAGAHAVLEASRAAKGRSPGLSLDYLRRLRAAFPGAVRAYRLDLHGRASAAALVYRVLPGRDLLVAWGDSGHDLQRSPMNLLAYHLVERSLASGARLLDLGPSTGPDGDPAPGLFQFKRSVLAQSDTRLTFVWRGPEG